ncbi:MAG: hypothetical protein KJ040_07055 [Gammaproteobacteria bacterium]|nr:hypothetical protein [Gammaproteobacteria bacterium]
MAYSIWCVRNDSSQRSARTALRSAFLLLALGFATATQAINVVEYGLDATSTSGSTSLSNSGGGTGGPQTVGSSFAFMVTSGGTDASVSYQPGLVGLQASSAWPSGDPVFGDPGDSHYGGVMIGIYDTLVMHKPAGSPDYGASLTFDILLTGQLSQVNGMARWFTEAELRAPLYRGPNFTLVQPIIRIDVEGRVDSGVGASGVSLPAMLSAQHPGSANTTDLFLYDTPIDLDWRIFVGVDGYRPGTTGVAGSAAANLGNTALWLGITARDSQGQIIEGLQFTSESGHNWATAVPLPPTIWMLLTAIGAAVGWRARRPFQS